MRRGDVGELEWAVAGTGLDWCPCGMLRQSDVGEGMNWGWINVES